MIRPTFLGFDTAKRGIMTSQKGLDITGQNLVNWDSIGYTRQRVEQRSVVPNTYSNRFGQNRIGVAGQGVEINGISQIRDKFLDKRFREQSADLGYYNQVNNILGDIEATIDELQPQSSSGLRAMLSNMFGALQGFSEDASSETHANIVLSSFKNITQTLNMLDKRLSDVAEQHKFDLEVSVNELNRKFQELAGLNEAISSDLNSDISNSRFGPNELFDQRNQLLDELSAYGDMDVTENADGTVTVKLGGHAVVDGRKYDTMRMNENNNGTVSLKWVSTNKTISTMNGALKASVDFINGRGPNMASEGETIYKGVLYYKDQLNTFADQLVKVANNIIPEVDPATGQDKVDANGNKIYKKLLGRVSDTPDANGKYPVTDKGSVTAGNISVSDEWIDNPSYIIYKGGSTENNYILKLLTALRDEHHNFPSRGGDDFDGTFNDFVVGYSTTLATDKGYYKNHMASTANLTAELQDSRDQVSGVVVDEEVANVMLYQKSLQAASRLMTTLDEALDVLINRTGIVGR